MFDQLFVTSQYLTPQHLLSRCAGKLAQTRHQTTKTAFITWFAKKYQVNMAEAAEENLSAYACFNDFFTRALKPDARPIAPDPRSLISPADGAISQLGQIHEDRIFQAKGHSFGLTALLGGDAGRAAPFVGGEFATIYLAPKDYHRVHMPISGQLREMVFVPGDLFSVNPTTAANVPELFARNERVVAIFDTAIGPVGVVLVGAMIVASIETVWAGVIAPGGKQVEVTRYQGDQAIHLARGAEMGRFRLGSTVVLVLPPNASRWDGALKEGSLLRMGQAIGSLAGR